MKLKTFASAGAANYFTDLMVEKPIKYLIIKKTGGAFSNEVLNLKVLQDGKQIASLADTIEIKHLNTFANGGTTFSIGADTVLGATAYYALIQVGAHSYNFDTTKKLCIDFSRGDDATTYDIFGWASGTSFPILMQYERNVIQTGTNSKDIIVADKVGFSIDKAIDKLTLIGDNKAITDLTPEELLLNDRMEMNFGSGGYAATGSMVYREDDIYTRNVEDIDKIIVTTSGAVNIVYTSCKLITL